MLPIWYLELLWWKKDQIVFFNLTHIKAFIQRCIRGRLFQLIYDCIPILVSRIDVLAKWGTFIDAKRLESSFQFLRKDRVADKHLLFAHVYNFTFVASLIWFLVFTITASRVEKHIVDLVRKEILPNVKVGFMALLKL